eukprot:8916696-Alexandrium_andersonii.AAC.1
MSRMPATTESGMSFKASPISASNCPSAGNCRTTQRCADGAKGPRATKPSAEDRDAQARQA